VVEAADDIGLRAKMSWESVGSTDNAKSSIGADGLLFAFARIAFQRLSSAQLVWNFQQSASCSRTCPPSSVGAIDTPSVARAAPPASSAEAAHMFQFEPM
jgi:hypothetical protein